MGADTMVFHLYYGGFHNRYLRKPDRRKANYKPQNAKNRRQVYKLRYGGYSVAWYRQLYVTV